MTTALDPSSGQLNVLFPAPVRISSIYTPAPLAGPTPQSTKTLVDLLRQNHVKFHCFFNDEGFHNHLSHHLLAAYALGATPELLKAAYDEHASYQVPLTSSPNAIDADNWKTHLGQHDHYAGYLAFFSERIINDGLRATLETYFFLEEANKSDVCMLSRLLSGLLHPLIHTGHGPEFGLPGMAAEGLAMAAVTEDMTSGLFPPEFFQIGDEKSDNSSTSTKHIFTIVGEMLQDPKLAYGVGADPKSNSRFQDAIQRSGERLKTYFSQWSAAGDVKDKIEEVAWLVTILYGLSGWRKDKDFKANFFIMHMVTSSLFLPSLLATISPRSQKLLLSAYVAVALTYWVGHGRPDLPIKEFYANTTIQLLPPHNDPTPSKDVLNGANLHQNPWLPLVESALSHPDEHLVKTQRTLQHWSSLLGSKPIIKADKGLPGIDHLDGTIFLRIAQLTGQAKGWVREGEPGKDWVRHY